MQTGTTDLFVPADRLNNAQVMSASDYIGKAVYDETGANIGEVNDLIISQTGDIQAVILGVGGFLGIGEKDVAVAVSSVKMVQDGDAKRLVVQATKESLESAPTYDRSNRRYSGGWHRGAGRPDRLHSRRRPKPCPPAVPTTTRTRRSKLQSPFSRAAAWEKVAEGRMRASCPTSRRHAHLPAMALTDPTQRDRARTLRRSDTAAEQALWEHLRARRLDGMKFVRQLVIGPFIADFACRERKLIVEVDGATHSTDAEQDYDTARTQALERQGWHVLRVTNTDVFKHRADVLETILHAAQSL